VDLEEQVDRGRLEHAQGAHHPHLEDVGEHVVFCPDGGRLAALQKHLKLLLALFVLDSRINEFVSGKYFG
jgi:hypothetical protein